LRCRTFRVPRRPPHFSSALPKKSQHTPKYEQLLKALRQARLKAGLTQGDVAEQLGTYASYVSKCESGERRIDVIELAEFCHLYGITLADILKSAGLT
jgi:ribosome-binding protein aMBF1 (putative translation factor)